MNAIVLSRAVRLVLAASALLPALAFSRWLESSMAAHMLLQLPLLVLAGWLGAGLAPARWSIARVDEYGITGLCMLLFVSACWMVPRALELSLASPPAEAAKFASLLLLGMVLPGSLKRSHWIVQLFFLGNFGAMTAIAGMQYQTMPQRLCNAYLLDDQNLAGMGLVAGAVLISVAWCVRIAPALAPPREIPAAPADSRARAAR